LPCVTNVWCVPPSLRSHYFCACFSVLFFPFLASSGLGCRRSAPCWLVSYVHANGMSDKWTSGVGLYAFFLLRQLTSCCSKKCCYFFLCYLRCSLCPQASPSAFRKARKQLSHHVAVASQVSTGLTMHAATTCPFTTVFALAMAIRLVRSVRPT
jgi:hypothetical protein